MVRQSFGLVRGSALLTNCFSFAKTCSIGFRSGPYPGRNIMLAPRASMASRTPETLWLPRLSAITISPGASVGPRNCSTQARKAAPLTGPSSTSGATIRSLRNPARNVVVFQCPCGTDAIRRSPRGARPRVRVMLVLVQVSSRKISRAGSSRGCASRQRWRASAMSARACSAAWMVFF
jgi:hypothetical protein